MLLYGWFIRIVADRLRVNHIGLKVEKRWEVDFGLVLFLTNQTFLLETFDMENQNLWSTIDTHLFSCKFMLFAVGTVPLVACLELFSFA